MYAEIARDTLASEDVDETRNTSRHPPVATARCPDAAGRKMSLSDADLRWRETCGEWNTGTDPAPFYPFHPASCLSRVSNVCNDLGISPSTRL